MGEFKVLISEKALKEIESIARYILADSPQNAAEVTAAIVETINSLDALPQRYRQVGVSALGRHRFMPCLPTLS